MLSIAYFTPFQVLQIRQPEVLGAGWEQKQRVLRREDVPPPPEPACWPVPAVQPPLQGLGRTLWGPQSGF